MIPGMMNLFGTWTVFMLRELIGLFRAERTGRALEEVIYYQAILFGITILKSFISEASGYKNTIHYLAF